MLSNYYTLAAVAADLDSRIRGRRIAGAYTQEKDELVITFEGMSGGLIISCSPAVNTLYLQPRIARARTNSVDVLSGTVGGGVSSVSIHPSDRVIEFRLDGGLSLCALFFGPKANVLVVDVGSRIRDAFKNGRTVIGTTHTPAAGDPVYDVTAVREMISQEPTQTVFALLKRVSPLLGSTVVNEIFFRSAVPLSIKAREISNERLRKMEHSYATLLTELAQPKPRVYSATEPPHAPYRFSLVKLEHCHECEETQFDDIHDAIRYFISRMRSEGALKTHASDAIGSLKQHQAKLQRATAAVEEDLANTARSEEYERYANLLMANLASFEKGTTSVTLQDHGESFTVPLDSKLTPIQNAQRYFERVKKSKLAYEQSRGRLVELKKSLRLVNELLATADAIHTKEELKKFIADRTEDLERFGIGEKAKEREQLPFRIFSVDGGFEVWAGKSSRNNDELTMKYAKPNDLWFHARGASGSHVILRADSAKGDPGKKAKTQAASIAAYYSKMKNATMVPVAMTEKKYVRKPKGAPPGTVVLEREKVIFVEPALPNGKPGMTKSLTHLRPA